MDPPGAGRIKAWMCARNAHHADEHAPGPASERTPPVRSGPSRAHSGRTERPFRAHSAVHTGRLPAPLAPRPLAPARARPRGCSGLLSASALSRLLPAPLAPAPGPLVPDAGQAFARAPARTAAAAESVSSAGVRAFSVFALFLASSAVRSLFSGVTKR